MAKNQLASELEPEVPAEEIAEADEQPAEETPEEPVAEEKPKDEPKEEKQEKFVPHQALHEERERRKQAQREAEQLRQNQAVLNDRVNQLWGVVQQPSQPQFRDPDKDPDPLEAMKHNQQLLAKQAHEAAVWRQQQEQRAMQQDGVRRLAAWGAAQAQEYARENPDFQPAYEHLRGMRAAELQAMGFAGEELAAALWEDEMRLFDRCGRSGRNPAEVAFEMARAVGWQPKAKEKPTAEQKIESLQKGAGAAKTLGGGGAQFGMPTPEQIANMGEEEFNELKEKLRSKGKRISDII